jgi:hypothetical protein
VTQTNLNHKLLVLLFKSAAVGDKNHQTKEEIKTASCRDKDAQDIHLWLPR